MRKKFLLMILILSLFSSMGGGYLHGQTDVTTVTSETDLATALAAGGDVQLGCDIEVNSTIAIPQNVTVTLDLNGKTIKAKGEFYLIDNDGDLTIYDGGDGGTIEGLGLRTGYTITRSIDAKLTINSGIFKNIYSEGAALYVHNGDVFIYGGEFYGQNVAIANHGGIVDAKNCYIDGFNYAVNATSRTIISNSKISGKCILNEYIKATDVTFYQARIGDANNWTSYETLADAIAAAKAGDEVYVFAGTYAVPTMKAGITINGELDGDRKVVLEGTLSGTLENLTLKNLHIKGANAQRWAYAKGDLSFENVTFEATSVYAIHFDSIKEGTNLLYKDCTIIGWAAMGGSPASCKFENCTIKDNGTYGVIRTYFNATIEDCTFDIRNANTNDVYQDGVHAVEGANVVVTECTNIVGDNGETGDMKDIVNVSGSSVINVDGVVIQNPAKVGDTYYATIQDAIVAAAPNGTVELLADVIVDKWIMFSESLNIGNGNIITTNINGLTIDGGDHSLTVKSIESAGNGNRLFFDATNLNIKNLTINYIGAAANQGGIGLTSGTIENVAFYGGGYAIFPGTGEITVKGCTFKTNATSIYYEDERDNLVVTGNKFENPNDVNVILLRGNTTFTGNNVISGRTVNVVSGSPVVSGNDFNDVRFKVYNVATATISENEINNLEFSDNSVVYSTFESDNTLSTEAQAVLDAMMVAKIGDMKYGSLQKAIDAAVDGNIITLIKDVTEDVEITQKAELDLTIDGDRKKYTGVMTVFGNGRQSGAETLTIKNIDFVAANGAISCIVSPDKTVNNLYSYSHNVTVDNCTFTDSDGTVDCAAIRHEDGGDKNWTVTKCTVDTTMHSLLQVNNVEGKLTLTDCIVKSKNGVNLNSCTNVEMTGCNFNVKGYALRSGVNKGGNLGVDKTYTLNNNTLKSACNDGDAVIMFRASTVDANLSMTENVVSGTTHISGNTADTKISADANYWDGKTGPVVAEGSPQVVVNSYYKDVDLTELVRNEMGSIYAYVQSNRIFGDVTTNAKKSIVIQIIGEDGNVIGTSSLENLDYATGFNNTLTWRINFGADDSGSWAMQWNEGAPSVNNMPAKVKLVVDAAEVAESVINYTADGDGRSPIFAAKTDAEGKINSLIACEGKYNLNEVNTFLNNSVAAGNNVAILVAGTYDVPTGKDLTITGAVDGVSFGTIGEVGMGGASVTFNNVTFNYADNSTYKGLQHSGNLVYNNCTFNGQVFLYGESETFNKCTFNQTTENYNVWTYGAKEVAFNECTFNSAGKSVLVYNEGACATDLTVEKTTFKATTAVDGKAAIEIDTRLMPAGTEIVVDGATTAEGFSENTKSGSSLWNDKMVVEGAPNGGTNSKVTVDNVVVKEAAAAKLAGAGTEEDPYLINNIDDLVWFRYEVNDKGTNYQGKYIKLTADIDLNNEDWTPIGTSANTFNGMFDGGDHTISNLYINDSKKYVSGGNNENYVGFFGYMKGGNTAGIKNLNIKNVNITGCLYVGSVLGRSYTGGIIENCHVTGSIQIDSYSYTGGIVGRHEYSKGKNVNGDDMAIYNCSVTGDVQTRSNENTNSINADYTISYVGGIVGFIAEGNYVIDDCSVRNVSVSGTYGVGGISGIAHYGNTLSEVSVDNVSVVSTNNDPESERTNNIGLIAGAVQGTTQSPSIIENVEITETTGSVTYTDGNEKEVTDIYGTNMNGSIPVTNYEARIGVDYYETFAEALAAVEDNQTITLLKNINTTDPITIKESITLDGNGLTLTYTGTNHAIEIPMEANGADVTVKNLTVDASSAERGINYNTNGTLTVENVTVTSTTYAINFPTYSDNATVSIKDSKLTSAIALNIWGSDMAITVTDSELYSVENDPNFSYAAIQLNRDDANGHIADGTTVTVNGGKLIATDENGDSSIVVSNWTATGKVIISDTTEVNGEIKYMVATYGGAGAYTLQEAIEEVIRLGFTGPITLIRNIELTEGVTVPAGKNITLDLNGKTITGTDNSTSNFGLIEIQPGAELTINDSSEPSTGKITLTATNDRDWNAYSSVISNQRGKLTVNGGIIEHLGGTDMAYGIDNLTNGKGTYAETVINGGTIKSTYRGIRQFLNGIEAQNILTVNGGTIEGANKSIWMQDPNKNANTGTLTVGKDAKLYGDVYLFVTAGSTEWPVEVSIAAAALQGESTVVTANLPEGIDVQEVNGVYGVYDVVASIGTGDEIKYYQTFEAALNAVQNGETITLLNIEGSESNEIEFTKDIEFTITGTAPNYALPVVTFQNATVNIEDAEILIPELDARQNATINVINSTVHDAGGNSIAKSYYNGALNISGTSEVYMMQVTTMGYITLSDEAKLHATWQTNVYGNGLITVQEDATFNTAALHLTGKDYEDRDNTDAERDGKPAEIVVDGANLTIGKVYSDNGADYSYNSSKGINVGTVDGKSAILNIKNGANVNIYMANGETANIGANGTVNVDASTFNVACRAADGTVTLANAGTVNVSGVSNLAAAKVTGDGWFYMNGVTLDADTKLLGAKVRFASGTNSIDGSTINDGFFQVGIGAYNGVDANVDTENGVVVNVKNAVVGANGETYAGWAGTGFYDTDEEKAAVMTDAKYVLNIENSIAEFGYLHVSNDGELNVKGDATEKAWYNNSDYSFYAGNIIINGTATFDATDVLALYTNVSCDNGTDKPGTLNIVNGTEYEAECHNGAVSGTNFEIRKTGVVNANAELYIGEYSKVAADAKFNIGGTVTALGDITNNGAINFTTETAKLTAPEGLTVNNATDNNDIKVQYVNGTYQFVDKHYVAEIVNGAKYESLAEAVAAAQDGATITLLWAEGETPIAMNASLYGKNVTITGTATVDWSKGWFYVGRGGAGNATLVFDNANLTSASSSASTGIHVSGREKGTDNKYDGTLVIDSSTIVLDYLINKGTMTLDNSTLTVKNGFSVGGRPASETESGEDATATITLNNNSKVVVNNHNGMGLGYETLGIMNINSGSTFETTQAFLVTAKGTMNVNGGNVKVAGTLANKGTVYVTGESNLDATVTGDGWFYMNGVTLNADTKLLGAKVGFINGENNIVGSTIKDGWFSVGIGQNTAAEATAAFATANGITLGNVTVNVSENATIYTSTDVAYSGWVGSAYSANKEVNKYILNINSSLARFGYMHVSKDGELNVIGHSNNKYEYAGYIVDFYAGNFINNGNVTLNGVDAWAQYTKISVDHADAVLNITNGTKYEANCTTGNVSDNTFLYYKAGTVNVDATSSVNIEKATELVAGAELNIAGNVTAKGAVTTGVGTINFTDDDATLAAQGNLTINYDLNPDKKVVYVDGVYKVVDKVYVAQIEGGNKYESLQEAINAVAENGTVTLIKDETFTEDNRTENNGWYEGVYYTGDKSFTIDLNDHTIGQNGSVNDYLLLLKNNGSKDNTITLKKGTIDAGTAAYCALATSTSNEHKITINTEDIKFVGNNSNGAVLKIRGGTELNVKAGTIITGTDNYVGIEAVGNGTVVNIYEDTEIYQNGTTSDVGSLVGASYNATVNVYGGKGTSDKGGFIVMTSGGTINVSGGVWTANTNGADANDNTAVLIAQNDNATYSGAGKSIVNVTGGTFKGGYNCYANEAGNSQINISGGNFNANPTDYVIDGYDVEELSNGTYNVIPTSGTQTRELEAGWHWFSTYVDLSADGQNSLDVFKAAFVGDDNEVKVRQIKNQSGYVSYNSAHNIWVNGGLLSVTNTDMYMINMKKAHTLNLTGDFADRDIAITLNTGWNWIGYPVNEEINLVDALSDLEPSKGDVIKSQTKSAYWTGTKWKVEGGFERMIPGEGYKYSRKSSATSLVYNTDVKPTSKSDKGREDNHWMVNTIQYPGNMTMIAMLSVDGEIVKDNYEIAAFANGECRGSARPIYDEDLDAYVLLMTIQGEEVEELTFKYYDVNYGTEYELSNRINYSDDAIVGSFDEPYMFNLGILNIEESSIEQINIYPNPTTTNSEINLQAMCDKVEVFNALGVKVAEYSNVDSIDAIETAGIYVIRVTIDGNARNCRLVVK